jgi:hypothetical protein
MAVNQLACKCGKTNGAMKGLRDEQNNYIDFFRNDVSN